MTSSSSWSAIRVGAGSTAVLLVAGRGGRLPAWQGLVANSVGGRSGVVSGGGGGRGGRAGGEGDDVFKVFSQEGLCSVLWGNSC